MAMLEHCLTTAYKHLTPFQEQVVTDCLAKCNGGLSLPMGSGKTLIALTLGLHYKQKTGKPCLIIVSKTLLPSWKQEIQKFFKDSLLYDVLHTDLRNLTNYTAKDDLMFLFTTPETVAKFYTQCQVENAFLGVEIRNENRFNQHSVTIYHRPFAPYYNSLRGGAILYSMQWGAVIIDEIQKYTTITSNRGKGLASLCAAHRWGLSGTMFNEPKTERILGYYLMIDHPSFPRNLPDADRYVKSIYFNGVRETMVYRKSNEDFVPPKVNEVIISHTLTAQEELVYLTTKEIMKTLSEQAKQYKSAYDTENTRRFNSYLLACLTYLRQTVVCPMLPIASAMLDMISYDNKSRLSEIMMEKVTELGLRSWMDDVDNLCSSRMKAALKEIDKHADERIVIFTSFRSCLDAFQHFIPSDKRPVMTISSHMSVARRQGVLEKFEKEPAAILLLTFDLGAEGLNLQCSCTVMLLDVWWNSGTTSQAISRVLRKGQSANTVNVYFFTSNTGVENAVFRKQNEKLAVLQELETGAMRSTVSGIALKEICKMIDKNENITSLQKINKNLF
jgi:SNF2 family DNA or RNA helicase